MITILIAVGGFVAGIIATSLFYRRNKNKQAIVNKAIDKVADKL